MVKSFRIAKPTVTKPYIGYVDERVVLSWNKCIVHDSRGTRADCRTIRVGEGDIGDGANNKCRKRKVRFSGIYYRILLYAKKYAARVSLAYSNYRKNDFRVLRNYFASIYTYMLSRNETATLVNTAGCFRVNNKNRNRGGRVITNTTV